jgi:hypothetical protein
MLLDVAIDFGLKIAAIIAVITVKSLDLRMR